MSRKYILDLQSFTEYIPAKFYEKYSWIRWQATVTARSDQTSQHLFNRFKLCMRWSVFQYAQLSTFKECDSLFERCLKV